MMAMAGSLAMLFVARIIDGLSGGNISTARAYVADITAPKDRARAYGIIGAAFGLGFILGPAISALLAPISYTAPIWAAAGDHRCRHGDGVGSGCRRPFTGRQARRDACSPNVAGMLQRPGLRRILVIDFVYWFAFAVFQTTFALFAARRFGFDAPQTGYFFAAFGVLGAVVQVTLIRPAVGWLGDTRTFMARHRLHGDRPRGCNPDALGAALYAGAGAARVRHRLRPPDNVGLVSRAATGSEQGRVQGAASAIESLGRTIGPVWGSLSLQRFGDGMPYLTAACFLLMTLVLSMKISTSD